jgi:hypothetical protein
VVDREAFFARLTGCQRNSTAGLLTEEMEVKLRPVVLPESQAAVVKMSLFATVTASGGVMPGPKKRSWRERSPSSNLTH